jgi:hypothetical protein
VLMFSSRCYCDTCPLLPAQAGRKFLCKSLSMAGEKNETHRTDKRDQHNEKQDAAPDAAVHGLLL